MEDLRMNTKTPKIVQAAMLAALCCIATMIIKIPTPLKGYVNLGDCIVLLSGWILSPSYAFLAAGIGSSLADVFSGYLIYAPATFIIKGLMAVIAHYCFKAINVRMERITSQSISGFLAELAMIIGYFLFEGVLYGFPSAAINIPANSVQGTAGLIIGIMLIKVVESTKLIYNT